MPIRCLFSLFLFLSFLSCQENKPSSTHAETEIKAAEKKFETTGNIERLDAKIDALISKDATIEILADGFNWSEGPLWIADGGYLLFCDIPANAIHKWSEKEGLSLYLKPSGYTGNKKPSNEPGSNGLNLDPAGNLILCQHGDRRMAKMMTSLNDPKPEFETIVDTYKGKRFNSPNDAVYDRAGNLYFTDPPYGLSGQMEDPEKELDFQGVYRYSVDGTLTLISDQLTRPNGIGLSLDEKTLYVANSDPERVMWMAYELGDDGEVLNEKVFYDATGTSEKGLPDGLEVDKAGNIWATGPGGVWIFAPDATVLGKIKTGELTSNCTFDAKEETLYMTCDDYLMRINL